MNKIPVSRIQAVMLVSDTNPAVAYYMLKYEIPYPVAVSKLELYRKALDIVALHRLKTPVECEMALNGLDQDEVEMLRKIPYSGAHFFHPTPTELKRGEYGRTKLTKISITPERVAAEMFAHETNPVVAYYMLRDECNYPTAVKTYDEALHSISHIDISTIQDDIEIDLMLSGLSRPEVEMLRTIPYTSNHITDPSPAEVDAERFPELEEFTSLILRRKIFNNGSHQF